MLLDVLAGEPELKVCVGYDLDGRRLDTLPARADDLARCRPVYDVLPGFDGPIDGCASFDDLPPAARGYVAAVERFVGVGVAVVSVGPDRAQTLLRG